MTMTRADEYRRKAQDCRLQASKARRDEDKAAWLSMAEDWERIAEGVDAPNWPERSLTEGGLGQQQSQQPTNDR